MPRSKTCLLAILLLTGVAGLASCTKETPSQPAAAGQTAAQPAPSAAPAATAPAAAPATPALQTQETNTTGVVAELLECKRKEGVLTVKVRLRNTSTARVDYMIYARNFDDYYITADSKKYFMLKDTESAYLATQPDNQGYLGARLETGQTFVWWAKFPAPPPEVKKINLVMPGVLPFEDVPITDR